VRAFVAGLLTMGYLVAALHFLRFWRRSGERLFLFFALAFGLLAAQRLGLTLLAAIDSTWLYGARLLAFLLLLFGIVEKNRAAR
jgi:hypothetical protein